MRIALTVTPVEMLVLVLKLRDGSKGGPVRGVCMRSILAATLVVVGGFAIEALVMKTVPISKPPDATKRKSRIRKESMILSTMVALGGDLTAGSRNAILVYSVKVDYKTRFFLLKSDAGVNDREGVTVNERSQELNERL